MRALPDALRRRLPGWRADVPEVFRAEGRHPGVHTVVACVGDSITRGQVSADYVDLLRRLWETSGFQFVNAGVNGDLAHNVARRLDEVIACRPDVLTLLVGTNDVNAQFDHSWLARYRRNQELPVDPSVTWYAEQVDLILARLQAETDVELVVLDLPPLGEDLASRMNGLVGQYNAVLHEVADSHGVRCLPLHARLVELLPAGHHPPAYEGQPIEILKAAARHMVLRQSWDDIAAVNGLAVLTDHIHLNDRAAGVVAELIGQVLGEPER